ncbi:MAG: CPBP family intramembrane metalloprotease [Euryarchaeota archaeon]|nr:CPBP family intramembrane metalloprotease [Euryarchaeota archaeon]
MDGAPLVQLFRFGSPWSAWLFYFTVSWLLAWSAYWSVRVVRPGLDWGWPRLLGVALVLWPFVQTAHSVFLDIAFVIDPTSRLDPVPPEVFWIVIERRLWQHVLLPLFGLYLAFGHHERAFGRVSIGRRVVRTLSAVDVWPRRGWLRDTMHGLWLFVAVFIGYLLMAWALSPITRRLENGDESQAFAEVGPLLAVALAFTAGITEEILFRGILQTRLAKVMPVAIAVVLQGVFFGLAHSGYGTWAHILLPLLLGTALGAIALWSGVWPLIIVHIGIDLVLFLATAADNGTPWAGVLALTLIPAALLPPTLYFGWHWARGRGPDDQPMT